MVAGTIIIFGECNLGSCATLHRQLLPVSSWRKGSRHKIVRGDARCFEQSARDGDTDELLCQVGATIASEQPALLPRKELFEAHAVAARVHRYFGGGPFNITELCAGCGLLAIFLVLLEPRRLVRCCDRKQSEGAKRLLSSLSRRWPVLQQQIHWEDQDIRFGCNIHREDLVVSCHACNLLTDEVMLAATADGARRPLVLVPCCLSRRPSLPKARPWMPARTWDMFPWLNGGLINREGPIAVNNARASHLSKMGYSVTFDQIDSAITKVNTMIVAQPAA